MYGVHHSFFGAQQGKSKTSIQTIAHIKDGFRMFQTPPDKSKWREGGYLNQKLHAAAS